MVALTLTACGAEKWPERAIPIRWKTFTQARCRIRSATSHRNETASTSRPCRRRAHRHRAYIATPSAILASTGSSERCSERPAYRYVEPDPFAPAPRERGAVRRAGARRVAVTSPPNNKDRLEGAHLTGSLARIQKLSTNTCRSSGKKAKTPSPPRAGAITAASGRSSRRHRCERMPRHRLSDCWRASSALHVVEVTAVRLSVPPTFAVVRAWRIDNDATRRALLTAPATRSIALRKGRFPDVPFRGPHLTRLCAAR